MVAETRQQVLDRLWRKLTMLGERVAAARGEVALLSEEMRRVQAEIEKVPECPKT